MRIQPNLVLPIAASKSIDGVRESMYRFSSVLVAVQRMSPLVRQIDFALEWMLVEAGKALYRYVSTGLRSNSNLRLFC